MTQRYGVETEIDKSIDTLAITIARCKIRLYDGTCAETSCAACDVYKKSMHVYGSFSDVDQLAIDNKVEDIVGKYIVSRASKDRYQKVHRESVYAPFIFGIILVILLFILAITTCGAAYPVKSLDDYHRYRFVSEPLYMEEYRKAVYDTLLATDKFVCDVNNDSTVNCQDWSLTFYRLWKDNYRFPCELVLNNNTATGMNHMFIAVKYSYIMEWEYIEPQAFKNGECSRSYFMEDYWGKMYNPLFNNICTEYLYNKYFIQKRRT